jgi:glycosyltransferase involved in cell wall biosynthesis
MCTGRGASKSKDERIKVLRIISRMNIGGPAIHVSLLCKKINQDKFESKLVTGSISASEGNMVHLMQGSNGMVRHIPELQREINPVRDMIAFLRIFKIMIEEKPLIVHTHTAKAGTIGRAAGGAYKLLSGKKIALVHTFHGSVLEGYFGPIKSKLFKYIERCMALMTDSVIAISLTQKDDLVNKYKIAASRKIQIINLGFDLSPFLGSNGRKQEIFRKQWSLDEDTILIGIVGRLVPIKNHHMFLDAAKLFLERYGDVDVRFLIVGDGEQRAELEKYVMDLAIGDKVLFCGWENDIPKLYANLDILAMTSTNEGTPVSIIEAMASLVPVISTDVGGIKDLLGEYQNGAMGPSGFKVCRRGYLCPHHDPTAFADGIKHIIDNELGKKSSRVQSARNYVLENYSEKTLIKKVEKLYERLLASE